MKMQCDVCQKVGASVFCAADEAALCESCDHSVHHANKLAGKHHRFSLILPSPEQIPLCDICQEKRAFLFCQQDRAILCRNCDASIHKANEHTRNHNRFLLTGIKLSVDSAIYVPPTAGSVITNNPVPVHVPVPAEVTGMGDRSSMSEYLMEMLPGWPVEDLLDSSSPSDDFCKTIEPLWDHDIMGIQNPFMSFEKMGMWVPQSPIPPSNIVLPAATVAVKNQKEGTQKKSMAGKKRNEGCFIVPEISSQPNAGFKRHRTSLW